jgi:protein-disulfide isomerase
MQELKAWQQAGTAAGVESTPTVYINGRRLTLSLNSRTLMQTLEDEMEWAAHNNAWAAD